MKKQSKDKLLAAKPDVDSAIKKHGFHAVKWVINKRTEEFRLQRQLEVEQKLLNERISAIRSKLTKL